MSLLQFVKLSYLPFTLCSQMFEQANRAFAFRRPMTDA